VKHLYLRVIYRFCKKYVQTMTNEKRTDVYYEVEKLGRREQRGIGSLAMNASFVCDEAPYNLVGRPT